MDNVSRIVAQFLSFSIGVAVVTVVGCHGSGTPPRASIQAMPFDLGTALENVGAMADVSAYDAKSESDRPRCAAYTIIAAVGHAGSAALKDRSIRPAGGIDLTECVEVETDFTCAEGKAVAATLQWGFAIGSELVKEALTPDGKLAWDAVRVEPCQVLP